MRYPRRVSLITGRLDFAPFAGVFFLLVLFLVLHSSLVPPPGLRVRLPTANPATLPGTVHPALVVAVDRAEQFYYDHQVIRPEALRARLAAKVRAAREPVSLVVQADEAVSQAALVRLGALAVEAGIREVFFQIRPPLFAPPGRPGVP